MLLCPRVLFCRHAGIVFKNQLAGSASAIVILISGRCNNQVNMPWDETTVTGLTADGPRVSSRLDSLNRITPINSSLRITEQSRIRLIHSTCCIGKRIKSVVVSLEDIYY